MSPPALIVEVPPPADREGLAGRLSCLVAAVVACGRRSGDSPAEVRREARSALLAAMAPAPPWPPAHRFRRVGRVAHAFRTELRLAGIGPDDDLAAETFAAIASRAIDRATLGDRWAGPPVWRSEVAPR